MKSYRMIGIVPLIALGMLVAGLSALEAHPQRLLAITETFAATRQAVAVYVQSIDLATPASSSIPMLLPGTSALAPPVVSHDPTQVLITSGTSWNPLEVTGPDTITALSLAQSTPFSLDNASRILSVPGWWQRAAAVLTGAHGDVLMIEGRRIDEYGVARGRIDLRTIAPGQPVAPNGMTLPLPGAALAMAIHPNALNITVLCASPDSDQQILCQIAPDRQTPLLGALTLPEEQEAPVPDLDQTTARPSLAVSRDAGVLFALTTGPAPMDSPGATVAWAHAHDASTLAPLGVPLRLPGEPENRSDALFPASGNTCWALTRTPGTDFAYLSLLQPVPGGLELSAQVALVGVSHPVQVALAPSGNTLAVAINERIELWREAKPYASHAFEEPVRCLAWTPEGLFAGEAGRVHQLDTATALPLHSLQLQTGHIAYLVPLVPHTEPLVSPSPDILTPPLFTLHAPATGRERRVIPLDRPSPGGVWHAKITGPAAEQIEVSPMEGGFPGMAAISLSGSIPATAQETDATVWIHSPDLAHPGRTDLRILRDADPVRRVLWVLADPDPSGSQPSLDTLDLLLSGPPHYFATRKSGGLHPGPLTAHSVVVLDAAAAAQGALTRPALLEFVSGGGGLLFIGGMLPEAGTRTLTDWLSPFGIQINTSLDVTGSFSAMEPAFLTRDFVDFNIHSGCGIRLLETTEVEASVPSALGAGQVVFVARSYGNGRVAVLAGQEPLSNNALTNEANRRFAATLFRWLSLAAIEVRDADEDGLTDSAEDRNGNGILDPGETDRYRADTDGDGIPDGMEDLNRNGRVDAGETNPLNPDSDGDGIHDGADTVPVPAADAPQVAYIEPRSFPAQGGMQILVTGRNLSPATQVWMGGRQAPRVQFLDDQALLAEAPPGANPAGETVDVRVVNPIDGRAGLLPAGAVYTAVSTVRADIVVTKGQVSVLLEHGPDAMPGRASFTLSVEPPRSVRWEGVTTGPVSLHTGRQAAWRVAEDGALWIDLSDGAHEPLNGTVAIASWTATHDADTSPVFRLDSGRVSAPNGVPLIVELPSAPRP